MKLTIYYIEGCPYCKEALDTLNNNKIKYHSILVQPDKKTYYKKKHEMSSFPQIFIDKYKIGGSTELNLYLSTIKFLKKKDIDIHTLYLLNTLQ